MTKEELIKEIAKLKDALIQHQDQVKDLEHDLNTANIRLEDVDKPKLTSKQFEDLHCAIEQGIDEFDFDSSDNYNIDLAMYDNTVEFESIEFNEKSELVDMVIQRAESVFGIADESDDEVDETTPSE